MREQKDFGLLVLRGAGLLLAGTFGVQKIGWYWSAVHAGKSFSALLRHPAVQEVTIVGMPDERWGEVPHAFVVLKAAATATETELRNYARDHLAHFKGPQRIEFVSELPKRAIGKVQKYVFAAGPGFRSSDRPNESSE